MHAQFRRTLPEAAESRFQGPRLRGASRMRKAWEAGEEPSIDEILDDPVMQQLMRRDRVEPAVLRGLVAQMRERLAANG